MSTAIEVIESSALAGTEAPTEQQIEKLGVELLKFPQRELPLTHEFEPHRYKRTIFMPKDTFVIGHKHKTRHINRIPSGHASVLMDGKVVQIHGPCEFWSDAGVRKVLYIHEDTTWQTEHETDLTDIAQLEDSLVEKFTPAEHAETLQDVEQLRLTIEPERKAAA